MSISSNSRSKHDTRLILVPRPTAMQNAPIVPDHNITFMPLMGENAWWLAGLFGNCRKFSSAVLEILPQ